ncbi:hypothetical protein FAN38_10890 [Salmonella enterica]|nr:hypothetical protein [Salmonella enterica]
MTVRVVFDITHTKDGIEVKSGIDKLFNAGCKCEVAFAAEAIAHVQEVAMLVNHALKADPDFMPASDGCVH